MLKRTFLYITTGFLSQGLLFMFWFIISRFVTTSEIGSYNYILYYLELFTAVVLLGGESVIARFYFGELNQNEVFTHTSYLTGLSCLCLFLLLFLLYQIKLILFKTENSLIYFCLPVFVFLNAQLSIGFAHFTAQKKPMKYLKLQLCKILVFLGASAIAVLFEISRSTLVLSQFFSIVCTFIYLLLLIKGDINFSGYRFKLNWKLLKYGFPLMIYGFVGVVTLYASRIMLENQFGLQVMGVYSFFLIIALQINGVWSSFNKSWSPEVYTKIQNGDSTEYLMKTLYLVVFIFLLGLVVFFLVGKIILFRLVIPHIYQSYLNNFLILLLFPVFTSVYTTLYPIFYYENKTDHILGISILSGLLQCLSLFFFINTFGILGASVGTLFSNYLNLELYLFFFRRQLRIPRETRIWLIFTTVVIIIASLTLALIDNFLIFILLLMLILGVTYFAGSIKDNLIQATRKLAFGR